MKNENNQTHSLFIQENKTEIKGITGVSNYSDKELCFQLGKTLLVISGTNLNMENLNVEGGFALISGNVNSVKYKKGAVSMLKRLSK